MKEVEIEDTSIPRDLDRIILHNGVSDRASTEECSQTTMYVPSTNDDDEALKIDDNSTRIVVMTG